MCSVGFAGWNCWIDTDFISGNRHMHETIMRRLLNNANTRGLIRNIGPCLYLVKKGKVFYGQEPPSGESTTTECGFNYQLLAVIYWSSLVAVNHSQLRTMASETVDPIDWLHPPPYTRQYPLSSTYCTLQCGLGCKSQDLLLWVRRDRATFGIPDQRTACAATQGRAWRLMF